MRLRSRPRVPAAARDLRELLATRGLVIPTNVPLVRSFSARRWAHRAWPSASGRCAGRWSGWPATLPDGASLSLALHDERVIIAHRIDVQHAPRAAAARTAAARRRSRSCCRPTTPRARFPAVVAEIPVDAADRALLVDDASHDDTTRGRARPRASTSSATRTTAATAAARRPATRGRCSTAPT